MAWEKTMAHDIVGAFSEDQVSRLTGLSLSQLRRWNSIGFIQPKFQLPGSTRRAFSRIYSFRDLLKLRVLNQLRNVYKVPLKELWNVERELDHMGDDKWTSQKLWVLNRRVVFQEPDSLRKREISSRQFVVEIPLQVVTADARADINRLNERDCEVVGRIEKRRQVHSSEEVFVGTRIPVNAIIGYIRNGFSDSEILRKFPILKQADVDAAREIARDQAA